ncbi:MAG: DUF3999 domain-containing protein [Candidatus Electrothrix sp. GW3-4]|uniref:DUF3999 domain-containing protein n=1 Tax=Candidatus Electrothrix sp. GW3-4 TaxID=3126740 RepID=UPI0030D47B4E
MNLFGEIMGDIIGRPAGRPYGTSGETERLFFRNFGEFLILVFLLACGSSVQAGGNERPLQREDFAYGMDLTISGNHAIYGLDIPAAVYQGCTRADLGDLRVFNASHPVPHLLRPQVSKETKRPAKALPFFPLLSERRGRSGSPPDLHIATNSQGTIIDIRQNVPGGGNQIVTAYILDTSGLEYPADWLEFAWEGQGEQFSTSVQVDASNDLNSWQTQVRLVALAELRFGGHTLLRKRIAVPQGVHRKTYLRISWPAGENGVRVTGVKAGYNRETQSFPRTMFSLTGEALPVTEQGVLRYQYDSKGFFPVDQLNIRLPEQNALSQVAVFSRADQEASWRRRASVLVYRLTVDGLNLDSGTIAIKRTTDRYWRLELEANSAIDQAPTLELGWLPGQLVFLAQGKKPYTLAYGRVGLEAAGSQVDRLLKVVDPQNEKKLVAPAQTGAQKVLGGEARLEVAQDMPWGRWLLWAVLVSGVMIVGVMALKLYREMNGQQSSL